MKVDITKKVQEVMGKVDQMSLEEVEKLHSAISREITPMQRVMEEIKERYKKELGDSDEIVIGNLRVYKQYRKNYDKMEFSRAESIIQDGDQASLVCEVNFTKARQILSPDVYKELYKARTEAKPTEIIKIGAAY